MQQPLFSTILWVVSAQHMKKENRKNRPQFKIQPGLLETHVSHTPTHLQRWNECLRGSYSPQQQRRGHSELSQAFPRFYLQNLPNRCFWNIPQLSRSLIAPLSMFLKPIAGFKFRMIYCILYIGQKKIFNHSLFLVFLFYTMSQLF